MQLLRGLREVGVRKLGVDCQTQKVDCLASGLQLGQFFRGKLVYVVEVLLQGLWRDSRVEHLLDFFRTESILFSLDRNFLLKIGLYVILLSFYWWPIHEYTIIFTIHYTLNILTTTSPSFFSSGAFIFYFSSCILQIWTKTTTTFHLLFPRRVTKLTTDTVIDLILIIFLYHLLVGFLGVSVGWWLLLNEWRLLVYERGINPRMVMKVRMIDWVLIARVVIVVVRR